MRGVCYYKINNRKKKINDRQTNVAQTEHCVNRKIIIFFNLIFIIFFLLIAELVANYFSFRIYGFFPDDLQSIFVNAKSLKIWMKQLPGMYSEKLQTFEENYEDNNYFSDTSRYKTICKSNKRPIIIFGCLFAAGWMLENEQTVSYKLSNQSNRSVYNFANPGWGPQHPLFLLTNEKKTDEVKNPEYIIYIMIDNHQERIAAYNFCPTSSVLNLVYPIKEGKILPPKKNVPFYYKFYLPRLLELTYKHYISRFDDKSGHFVNDTDWQLMVLNWKNVAEEKYKNVKTVVFMFPAMCVVNEEYPLLEKNGVIILKMPPEIEKKFIDNPAEYQLYDKHPNEKAWDIIVPEIIKQLKL